MGSPDDFWKEACFITVSFGDVLGGSTAQLAISDCADKFMGVNTRKSLNESIYMDDIMLPSYSLKDKIGNIVDKVDTGINKANFNVKEWVLTGEKKKKIKFLSYIYYSETDTFSVRPKINWSPLKRA